MAHPVLVALFHALTEAFELLSDPKARAAFDTVLAAKKERKRKHDALDAEKRQLRDQLHAREHAAKKQKADVVDAERKLKAHVDALRKEGEARRKEHAASLKDLLAEQHFYANLPAQKATAPSRPVEEDDPLDRTLIFKWDKKQVKLKEEAALVALLEDFAVPEMTRMKKAQAVVSFKTIENAYAVHSRATSAPALKDTFTSISWAKGKPPDLTATETPSVAEEKSAWPDLTTPATPSLDFEAVTLIRMRKAEEERQRALEREKYRQQLLEEEAAEHAQ